MKGKIRRIALTLLAAVLLVGSLAGCGQNNPSVLKLPDGTAAAGSQVQETPGPLTPIGDKTCRVGQETIPESTLFSFILTQADFDPLQGLTLKLKSANKSPVRGFTVTMNYLAVNGYMQDVRYEASVPAGQSVTGEILIPATDLRSTGVSSVDELILYPLISDESMPMGQGDVVNGAFSFYPSGLSKGSVVYPVRQNTAGQYIFLDNGFASVIVMDAQTDAAEGLLVRCYLENKTERVLSFAWSDASLNGASVVCTGDAIVAPGMRRYVTMNVPAGGLAAGNNEVAFKMSATPLSDTGDILAPLVEQRGVYSFTGTAAADPGSGSAGAGTEPGDDFPEAAVTASPAPTMIIYTSPTAAQKKNAKNGYINKDKVNMRSGPGTKYKTVGNKIDQNSTAILYELQDGWWFLKCNNKYGYVKADYVSQGKPKATPKPDDEGKTFDGVVTVQTKAALRKSADPESKCLKELSNGAKVTVYYKTKGKDGHTWYCVTSGKTKGYIRTDLVKVTGKVPTR